MRLFVVGAREFGALLHTAPSVAEQISEAVGDRR
jgi:hypothetical protein